MGKFNFKDEQDFQKVSSDAEAFYVAIGEIHCPYFGEKIIFNTAGFKHLKFKSDKVARSRFEQYARLKLINLAPQALSLSRTVQGIWATKCFERIRVHSRTDTVLKPVSYFEFIAVLDNVRVKVIVKQIDSGRKFFWSIIPYWKIDSVNSRRILHSGKPEND
ncbi:hypothetical protein L6274_02640 [Candidatus Parcubacteria bacterium]|nr:hypothetical protein [Candidatus Parcubacteria bacterium]MCG2808902.1 hypothetical protein [Candidatus Portnoybacteria bacterium]